MIENPVVRRKVYQGETWNAAWLARGPQGQILTSLTASPTGSVAITSIGWAIYGAQEVDGETLLASQSATPVTSTTPTNADAGLQVLSASTFNGFSEDANGHTVRVQIVPVASGAGWIPVSGKSYRLEVELGVAVAVGTSKVRLQSICAVKPWLGAD